MILWVYMNDTQINSRQLDILSYLLDHPSATRSDIENSLESDYRSRITIIRDLNHLIECNLIAQIGGGKYVKYSLINGKELLIPVDLERYFKKDSESRPVKYPNYNPKAIKGATELLTENETRLFEKGKVKLEKKFGNSDPSLLKRELERFIIEFSWKSSQIEGNTYSLLETEDLIKNQREAKGHDKREAVMILNHKRVFDTIFKNRETLKVIGLSDIKSIHAELVRDLGVTTGIREAGVGITGTKYLPVDNKWQIQEGLEKLVTQVESIDSVPEKALILLCSLSYLQPFNDGNKRTSRMVSNAILFANGYYPLSYRSVDEVEYKKALILFYEQNNLYHLKRIFLEQQKFAIDNYFL
jgi:prophage maintenance system killer protein